VHDVDKRRARFCRPNGKVKRKREGISVKGTAKLFFTHAAHRFLFYKYKALIVGTLHVASAVNVIAKQLQDLLAAKTPPNLNGGYLFAGKRSK
jgi:hypothetical protein